MVHISFQGLEEVSIVLKVIFNVIIMLVSLLGNLVVLVTILSTKSMRNHTNFYLCNLALSDILVAGICMWVHLGQTISRDWPFGPVLCVLVPFFRSKSSSIMALIDHLW